MDRKRKGHSPTWQTVMNGQGLGSSLLGKVQSLGRSLVGGCLQSLGIWQVVVFCYQNWEQKSQDTLISVLFYFLFSLGINTVGGAPFSIWTVSFRMHPEKLRRVQLDKLKCRNLISSYNMVWVQYKLEDMTTLSPNGFLNHNTILLLDLSCKKLGKKDRGSLCAGFYYAIPKPFIEGLFRFFF